MISESDGGKGRFPGSKAVLGNHQKWLKRSERQKEQKRATLTITIAHFQLIHFPFDFYLMFLF